jgi:hypothetical protein
MINRVQVRHNNNCVCTNNIDTTDSFKHFIDRLLHLFILLIKGNGLNRGFLIRNFGK